MSDLLVQMEAVSKQYLAGDLTVDVLRDVNLEIPRGEFVVVLMLLGHRDGEQAQGTVPARCFCMSS